MFHLFRKLKRQCRWGLYRKIYLKGLDSVEDIQKRNIEFDQIHDVICRSGTDNLKHFGNEYSFEGGLSLQQNPHEFAALICRLKEHKQEFGASTNYLEIGSASGGTCLLLSQIVGFANIFSLDDGMHPRATEQKENFSTLENFTQFLGDSHSIQAQQFIAENVKGKLDVVFIDGDHSYNGVKEDFYLVLPFCRPGALVIFHDTVACAGVENVWIESVLNKQLEPLAEYIGTQKPLGIGVGRVI